MAIRCPNLYRNNKKIAELQTVKYRLDSNDEAQVTTEGYLDHSDGQMLTSIDAECIVPVAGVSVDLVKDMLDKKSVDMGIPVDGKYHQMKMRVEKAEYSGDAKSGKLTGSFTFGGGAPARA